MDIEKLAKLAKMKKDGMLSEKEFQSAKKKLFEEENQEEFFEVKENKKSENNILSTIQNVILELIFIGIVFIAYYMYLNTSYNQEVDLDENLTEAFDDSNVNADLFEMYNLKKENEYAFNLKYQDRDLTFNATVFSVEANCYVSADGTKEYPCLKIEHPERHLEIWGMPTSIASAEMKNNDVLTTLKKKQKIQLTCRLNTKTIFSIEPLEFKDCYLYE